MADHTEPQGQSGEQNQGHGTYGQPADHETARRSKYRQDADNRGPTQDVEQTPVERYQDAP